MGCPNPCIKYFRQAGLSGSCFFDFLLGDELQPKHLLGHHLMGIVLPVLVSFAYRRVLDALTQNPQDGHVDLLLPAGKLAAYGNGSGEVRIVISVACPDVHEQQLALFAFLIVLQVMQGACIGSGCNDGRVRELAPSAYEFTGIFSLDLKLFHTGFDHAPKPCGILGWSPRRLP